MGVVLGAIADDFTGATDLANTLVGEGMSVVQVIGVPQDGLKIRSADAVVVALKSRTAPVAEAVAQSTAALEWLTAHGAEQIIFKYCSTFDSTPDGNIGPVADALLAAMGEDFAVICPAFPANRRTIYKGTLFVGDLPLAESSMKDHPLTPMRDSSLIRLMDTQSQNRCGLIPLEIVRAGPDSLRQRMENLQGQGMRYGVVDALTDGDLRSIGAALANHRLVTWRFRDCHGIARQSSAVRQAWKQHRSGSAYCQRALPCGGGQLFSGDAIPDCARRDYVAHLEDRH